MKQLRSFPISEPWQVEIMRQIYNDNLDMLATKPLPQQTYEGQQAWWNANKHMLRGYLYEPVERPGKFVAFLVLTDRGGFWTPIMALQKEEWNHGYGRLLITEYIEKANAPLAGKQLQSNGAICHLNKKAGWHILGEIEQSNEIVDLLYHPGINQDIPISSKTFDAVLDYLDIDKKLNHLLWKQIHHEIG